MESADVPLLIVISAPSGAGKTTLCEGLLGALPNLRRAVTCTTRAPRSGERAGVDYHFLEAAEFARRVKAGEFLEHARVYGNDYGTLRAEVTDHLAAGCDVLLAIDVQGAASVRERAVADTVLGRALVEVFVMPPSLAELEERLRSRGTEDAAIIERRLAAARQEISQWPRYDYVLVSRTREDDLRRLRAIVEAERMRRSRCRIPAEWAGADSTDGPSSR